MAQLVARPPEAEGRELPSYKACSVFYRAVAQLVARFVRDEEVASSSLASPTKLDIEHKTLRAIMYVGEVVGSSPTSPTKLDVRCLKKKLR